MIGAFHAVASTCGVWNGRVHTPAVTMRPLPAAVLVHVGHSVEAQRDGPVGIAVPSLDAEGRVVVDAVLASSAVQASDLIRTGPFCAVSIVTWGCPPTLVRHWRDLHREILVAVDVVDHPADRNALIDRVFYVNSLTEGQRRTREALDSYLADGGPCQVDFSLRFDELGIAAFDPLAPIVAPLRAERQLVPC